MSDAAFVPPHVNGILETSLYVESAARSVEFYKRVFGFELIDADEKEGVTDETRLCAMHAGDRSVLLLFKKGATDDTDATGAIHIAFGIARSEVTAWEQWLAKQGIAIEFRKTWKHGAVLPRSRRALVGSRDTRRLEYLLTLDYREPALIQGHACVWGRGVQADTALQARDATPSRPRRSPSSS